MQTYSSFNILISVNSWVLIGPHLTFCSPTSSTSSNSSRKCTLVKWKVRKKVFLNKQHPELITDAINFEFWMQIFFLELCLELCLEQNFTRNLSYLFISWNNCKECLLVSGIILFFFCLCFFLFETQITSLLQCLEYMSWSLKKLFRFLLLIW